MVNLKALVLLLNFLATTWVNIFFFDMGFCYDIFPHHKAQRNNHIKSWSGIFISCQSKLIFSFVQLFSKLPFIVKEYKYHLCLIPVFFIWFYKEIWIFDQSSKWSLLFFILLGILSLILFLIFNFCFFGFLTWDFSAQ